MPIAGRLFKDTKVDIDPIQQEKNKGIWHSIWSSLTQEPRELGRDIAELFSDVKEGRASIERLKKTDPETAKMLEEYIGEKPTALKTAADIAGTALMVAPVGEFKALAKAPTILRLATRGATIGGAFGLTNALSRGEKGMDMIKDIAMSAGAGALLEPTGAGVMKAVRAGLRPVGETITKIAEKYQDNAVMKAVASVESRIRQLGQEGNEIMDRFLRVDDKTGVETASYWNNFKKSGLFDLTDEEAYKGSNSLVDVLEGKVKPEVKPIPKELEPLAEEARKYKSAEEFLNSKVITRFLQEPEPNTLTHATNLDSAISILQEGQIKPKQILEREGEIIKKWMTPEEIKLLEKKPPAISFSRKKGGGVFAIDDVKFVFDKEKLSQIQKPIPMGSERIEAEERMYKPATLDKLKYIEITPIWEAYQFKVTPEVEAKIAARVEKMNRIEQLAKEKGIPVIRIDDKGLTDFYNQATKGIKEVKPEVATEKIKPVFDSIDTARTEIGTRAKDLGVMVRRSKAGVQVPFEPRPNYYTQALPPIETLKSGPIRERVLFNAVTRRGAFTAEEAPKVLDDLIKLVEGGVRRKTPGLWERSLIEKGETSLKGDDLKRILKTVGEDWDISKLSSSDRKLLNKASEEAGGMTLRYYKQSRLKKFNPLEVAREFDNPFYDADPRVVMPKYVFGAVKRLNEIEQFGVKGEILNRLMGSLKNKVSTDKALEAKSLVDTLFGVVQSEKNTRNRMSLFLRTLNIPKLTFSQIINASQSLNTLLYTDAPSLGYGITQAFKQVGRDFAERTGAFTPTTVSEITLSESSRFAHNWLKYTGFEAIERFNRVIASLSGKKFIERNFARLMKDSADKVAKARLEELGINIEKSLKQGFIDESEILMGAKRVSDITQFRAWGASLPQWASSPEGKVLFQFKNFSYNQAKIIKNTIKRDIKIGNYSGVLRTLGVIGLIFPVGGEVFRDIQSLVTQSRRPTPALDRYIEDLTSAGGMGIWSDFIESTGYGPYSVAKFTAGPAVSSLFDILGTAGIAIKNGKMTNSQLYTLLRQVPGIGPIASNMLKDPTVDKETAWETIMNLADIMKTHSEDLEASSKALPMPGRLFKD